MILRKKVNWTYSYVVPLKTIILENRVSAATVLKETDVFLVKLHRLRGVVTLRQAFQ